jgi:hypothetical protein
MKKRSVIPLLVLASGISGFYRLVVSGALTLDTGMGRRTRPLGPIARDIAAPPEVVFDVIATPYLGKTPKAMEEKLHVLERGSDMVLAEHFTDVGDGRRAITVETVRFERPNRISFRLLRGPVPYVVETFELQPQEPGTAFSYTGEIGGDFWGLGQWWIEKVAAKWEQAVEHSLQGITEEAERLAKKSNNRSRTP